MLQSTSKRYPHLCIDNVRVDWKEIKQFSIAASYVHNFDCKYEMPYWFCIKDTPFDIDALKSKRRYEIKKGLSNFNVVLLDKQLIINNINGGYSDELYYVQQAAFGTYPATYRPIVTQKQFFTFLENLKNNENSLLFVAFDNKTRKICGYLDTYEIGCYVPLSTMKALPSAEKNNVNFALVYALCEYYKDKLEKKEVYLCDGARSFYHQTNFQDFLTKYFGFRYAFAHYHIEFKFPYNIVMFVLSPFRGLLSSISFKYIYQLKTLLELYEVSNQCNRIKKNA